MHTARGSLRLRSRGAHCDPELARQDRRSRLARKEARRKEEGGGKGEDEEAAEAEAEAEEEQL